MARKIYIGQTYRTKLGTEFTVDSIEKGKKKFKHQHRNGRAARTAIDKDGNRLKVSNLLTIIEA